MPRSEGKEEDELEEKLEDTGGKDPGHVKGKALLTVCLAEKAEEIATTQSLLDALLPAYHQDVVEESEKEEGNERNGEGLACGRDPPLRRHGRLDQTHNSQANGWKLKECQSHNLKFKKKPSCCIGLNFSQNTSTPREHNHKLVSTLSQSIFILTHCLIRDLEIRQNVR